MKRIIANCILILLGLLVAFGLGVLFILHWRDVWPLPAFAGLVALIIWACRNAGDWPKRGRDREDG